MYQSNISNYSCDEDEKVSILEHLMWNNWSSDNVSNKSGILADIQPAESNDFFAPMKTFRDEGMFSHRIPISNDSSHITIDRKNGQKLDQDNPGKDLSFAISNQILYDKSAQAVSSFLPFKSKSIQPLSAYNMFFQLQRKRIISHDFIDDLNDIPDHKDTHDDLVKLCRIRQMNWTMPQPKRQHRKSHNNITFRELSKYIARKWKEMNPIEKKLYTTFVCQEKQKFEKEKQIHQQEEKFMKKKEVVVHRDHFKTTSYEYYKSYSLNLQDESKLRHQNNYIQKFGDEIVVEEQEDSGTYKIQCKNTTTNQDITHAPQDVSVSRCFSNCTNSFAPTTKETEKINLFSQFKNDSNMLEDYCKTMINLSSDVANETQKRYEEFNARNSSMEQTYDLNVFEYYKSNNMNHKYLIDDHYNTYDDNNIEDNNNEYLKSIEEMEEEEVERDKMDEQLFKIMKRIQYRSILMEKKLYRKQQRGYNYSATPNPLSAENTKSSMLYNYNMESDDGGCGQSLQSPLTAIDNNESSVDSYIFPQCNYPLMMMTDRSSNSIGNALFNNEEEVSQNEEFFDEFVNDKLNHQHQQQILLMPEIENYLDDNNCLMMMDNDEFNG